VLIRSLFEARRAHNGSGGSEEGEGNQEVSSDGGRERIAFRSSSMDQGSQGERSSGALPNAAHTVR